MTLQDFRGRALVCLFAGYVVLNYVFIQLRVPPSGFGVPLGELFLIFVLCTTNTPVVLARMGSVVNLWPFMIWWAFGLSRVIVDGIAHGMFAFRDATQMIESLYVLVGFTIAGHQETVERLSKWLPAMLVVAFIYALGIPFEAELTAISPTIPGASKQPIPILTSFPTRTILMWFALYCFIAATRNDQRRNLWMIVGSFAIAFIFFVVQARTSYLQLIGVAAILLIFRRQSLGKMTLALPAFALALAIIDAFDLRIAGRLTGQVSLSFFTDHIASIFGQGAGKGGGIAAAAEGVPLRISWWTDLYRRLTSDGVTLLTGLGYGIPLTNFTDPFGVTTREPHNSYISVVSRVGLIGFGAWAWMQVELFRAWLRSYRQCHRLGMKDAEDLMLMIFGLAALLLIEAFGEDAMEKPYNTILLYGLWGFALRFAFVLRTSADRSRPVRAPVIPLAARQAQRHQHAKTH